MVSFFPARRPGTHAGKKDDVRMLKANSLKLQLIFKNTIEKQSAGTPFLNSILDPGVEKVIVFYAKH